MREQAANRSNNTMFYDGEGVGTCTAMVKKYGLKRFNYISTHLKDGWTPNALTHSMKHPELGIRKDKATLTGYIDKNGNPVDIPDYGAKILDKKLSEEFDSSHIANGPITLRFREGFVNPYQKLA